MILLIDNYDSFTYNIFQYVEELGYKCVVKRNDEITLSEIVAMKPQGIIISPGPGNPDESGIALSVIEKRPCGVPILGVCLGHQAIGQVFGGKVVRAPRMMHGKLSKITHSKKGVFKGIKSPLEVMRYHSLIVKFRKIPSFIEVTAKTSDGLIMGLRHLEYDIEGIQFHPESFATEHGKEILQNFLRRTE